MSDTSDKLNRSVALDKALAFWAADNAAQDSDILKTAEAFRAFLAGETAEEPSVIPPKMYGDYTPSWIYFKFQGFSPIYYRADINKGPYDRDAVERKSYATQNWTSNYASGNPKTRAELRDREDYVWVPRSQVPAAYLK